MAKEVAALIKLQIKGGAANPSPPIGPALGSKGINIMEFCKQFNARTQDKPGKVLPVLITVYADKSFDFIIKTPPAAVQLMEAAKIKGGSKDESILSSVGIGLNKGIERGVIRLKSILTIHSNIQISIPNLIMLNIKHFEILLELRNVVFETTRCIRLVIIRVRTIPLCRCY